MNFHWPSIIRRRFSFRPLSPLPVPGPRDHFWQPASGFESAATL